MIAEAMGWKIDKFEQQMKPIVTGVDRKSPTASPRPATWPAST